MRKILPSLTLIFFTTQLFCQTINLELKNELDSIMILDQSTRELLDPTITEERKSELLSKVGYTEEQFYSNPWGIIIQNDSINQQRVFNIIAKYGYPGKSMVGEPTNKTAWYVIQHSEFIEKYLPLIKEAGQNGELPMPYVAMMEDRYLMETGKEQMYGTQALGAKVTDKITGEEKQVYFIWPIKNPETVNERRESIGFKNTIEEYAASMDIEYEVFTLDQINEMLKK